MSLLDMLPSCLEGLVMDYKQQLEEWDVAVTFVNLRVDSEAWRLIGAQPRSLDAYKEWQALVSFLSYSVVTGGQYFTLMEDWDVAPQCELWEYAMQRVEMYCFPFKKKDDWHQLTSDVLRLFPVVNVTTIYESETE